MATQKLAAFNDSRRGLDEVTPKTVSTGAADAGKFFVPGADGKFDETLIPNIDGARAFAASEALSAGDFVNIFDDEGVPKIRKADASSLATRAHGAVKIAAAEGETVKMYGGGVVGGFSGLQIGETYFLSDTNAGEEIYAPPTAAGHIVQSVGVALSATEMQVNIGEMPIVRG